MMTSTRSPDPPSPSSGQHLGMVSHEGRFWDVYLEFDDDPRRPDTSRARLCFSPSDLNEGEEPIRTATIIIEPSYEEAMRKARAFEDHHLVGLLRSARPD
ncbi:MAG: hypothetical protein KY453_07455 [Gemmatimonadetes bacterium]|nr:hypothetical protein [Gemmatimonadota bacterium]